MCAMATAYGVHRSKWHWRVRGECPLCAEIIKELDYVSSPAWRNEIAWTRVQRREGRMIAEGVYPPGKGLGPLRADKVSDSSVVCCLCGRRFSATHLLEQRRRWVSGRLIWAKAKKGNHE
jgi:hypothetical protein